MSARRLRLAAAVALLGLALGGCTASADDRPPGTPAGSETQGSGASPIAAPAGELTIFAAASLGGAFDELASRFEQRHPQIDVLPLSYDGSSTLATQLIEGAPADVFAAADESSMQRLVDAGRAADPELFASNTLVIAVPRGNPGGVKTIEDLTTPGLTVVLCAQVVPCGAASQRLLAANRVELTPASLEQNVTAVLTKVATGEADAGLVYATDIRDRADVQTVAAAGSEGIVNHYPIAVLSDSPHREAAEAFVAFVLSADGRALLDERGFGAP
jgi:molybdate transport system substrate-binding protein